MIRMTSRLGFDQVMGKKGIGPKSIEVIRRFDFQVLIEHLIHDYQKVSFLSKPSKTHEWMRSKSMSNNKAVASPAIK